MKYETIDELREIVYHEYLYRVECMPEISDSIFDGLINELERLEIESGLPIPEDSPTQVVGSELMDKPKLILERNSDSTH